MFVVGIDGGGTKTRVAVCASDGTLLHRETLGAFNLSGIGEDGFRRRVGEILTLCGDMRACGALCVGGAGASGAAMGGLRADFFAHGFAGKLLLCGDHEIALAGAMQTPGCVLIAGTGSICYGKNAAGEHFRCGGGGHIIDDPGSGYALGRDALAPRFGPRTAVFPEKCAPRRGDGHCRQRRHSGEYSILSISPAAARATSPRSRRSCCDARRRGTRSVLIFSAAAPPSLPASFRRSWENSALENGSPCALAGGLLAEDNVYRRAVCAALAPFCRPAAPEHDALFGAVQLALAAIQ